MITKPQRLPKINHSNRTKVGGSTSKGPFSKYGDLIGSSDCVMSLRHEKERNPLAPAKDLLRYIRQSRKYKSSYMKTIDFEKVDTKKLIYCSESQPQGNRREDRRHNGSFLPDIVTSTTKYSHDKDLDNVETTKTDACALPTDIDARIKFQNYPSNDQYLLKSTKPLQSRRINFPMPTTPRKGRVDHVWPEGHKYHVKLRLTENRDRSDDE